METNLENKLSKVLWRCHRGMLELDVMLQRFCNETFLSLSDKQQSLFEELLEEADQDLHRWLISAYPCEKPQFQDMLLVIRHMHTMSQNSELA